MNPAGTALAGALGALLAATTACAQGTGPLAPDQVFERVSPSVWVVETIDAQNRLATGSAVVTAPGRLVTTCGLVANARRIAVTRDNVSYGAQLDLRDAQRDLCELSVANFKAPAVTIASYETVRTGARLYAIGAPQGQDLTINEGMFAGLRRQANGDVQLQVNVPVTPGTSGGGVFDDRGRLVAIANVALQDAQKQNFAMPATWIAQLAQRAQAMPAAPAATLLPAVARVAPAAATPARRVFAYRLRDRMAHSDRTFTWRLDKVEGDRLVFNGGARIEKAGGGIVQVAAPEAGDFDLATPPGGWLAKEPEPGAVWNLKYRYPERGVVMSMRARTLGEEPFRLKDRELRTIKVEFKGYTERGPINTNPSGGYRAFAWYSPDLQRIVRFQAKSRGGVGGAVFVIDETLELVDVRDE